jgi:bifunctional DNA-binding transcriptional regulator/antitoxin component of YhaV-PrlF toxin-antitoxin module
MQSTLHQPVFSKISVENQTVIPVEVRERLRLRPCDVAEIDAEVGAVLVEIGN